ncbi:hypothetical protein P153DRAFT_360375 [Dothidotthia symphoricarpi CBS 119687]|uniref:Uncharacterized protein n=1 Tax=Dothidotthia symphoricarpi CBS 119687 TaxID=1392245 RepID=A0A6A6A0P4_9PLEO|nr:uncharacterized protein P153DRAFT_360375 [Dothidotthia symphoricarpi CBS 119687]KAF2125390.1 hypothetical protein P153DRAFT_360375 [Dothidotthia symphoricarpi CBS 119687]
MLTPFLLLLLLTPLAAPSPTPQNTTASTTAFKCGTAITNTGFAEQLLATGACQNVQNEYEPYKTLYNYYCGVCVAHLWRDCTGGITYWGGPIGVRDQGVGIPWSFSYACF